MKAYRLNQASISILLLAVLLFGFIPVQSAHATPLFWDLTVPMATARSNQTATLLTDGKVLVAGGQSGGYLTNADLYDPASTGSWTPTDALKHARSYHTATLLTNGKVLVVGGLNLGGYLSSAELYDPAASAGSKWTNTVSLHAGRYFHTATLLSNGQVLVVGGYGYNSTPAHEGILDSAELYDPITGLWTVTGSLNTGRDLHTATLLRNGQVLVAGGQGSSGYLNSAELYDPTTGTWTNTGSLAARRKAHTATLLTNGNVLVVGGYNNIDRYFASTELYDSTARSWTGAGSLTDPRSYHTATLLAKGQVLVVGGSNDSGLSSAELYDPIANSWTGTGSLNNARRDHTTVQLFNGLVLAVGGLGYNPGPPPSYPILASAELYDPSNPTLAPNVPVTVSPNGDTNTQPSYIWHYSIGATSYHLTVDSISPSSTVIDHVVVNTSFCSGGVCTYHPLDPLPVGNYEFKVNASNGLYTSVDSVGRPFNVFGNRNISGNVGVEGVILTYYDLGLKTATAHGSGDYSFDVSYNWSGTVTPSLTGYLFTPSSKPYTNVTTDKTNENYTATPITYTISGNAGVAGATLSYTDVTSKTATADGLGNYSFTVSYNWTGTVTPSLLGYIFAPASLSYTNVLADKPNRNYIATATNFTISGNAGVAGATLSYMDVTPKTATADDLGNYSFSVPAGWTGTITPSSTGYTFTPTSINVTTPVTSNLTGQDFTAMLGVPTTTGLSPASATAGEPAFTLTVNGTNFVNGSTVRWNDSDRTTTYVSSTQLTASIPAADIAAGGTASVTVFNAAPSGGTSNAQTFTINNPVPTTTGLSPASATAGGPAFTLTVNGTNFVNDSTVRWNDSDRTTTYVSNTQLTASIPAADIATAGSASVTVFNAAPGGGTSNAQTFTINTTTYRIYLPLVVR